MGGGLLKQIIIIDCYNVAHYPRVCIVNPDLVISALVSNRDELALASHKARIPRYHKYRIPIGTRIFCKYYHFICNNAPHLRSTVIFSKIDTSHVRANDM